MTHEINGDGVKQPISNTILIMRCKDGWYPIEDFTDIPLSEKAQAHGIRNAHIERIEDIDGNVLWRKQ